MFSFYECALSSHLLPTAHTPRVLSITGPHSIPVLSSQFSTSERMHWCTRSIGTEKEDLGRTPASANFFQSIRTKIGNQPGVSMVPPACGPRTFLSLVWATSDTLGGQSDALFHSS